MGSFVIIFITSSAVELEYAEYVALLVQLARDYYAAVISSAIIYEELKLGSPKIVKFKRNGVWCLEESTTKRLAKSFEGGNLEHQNGILSLVLPINDPILALTRQLSLYS